MAWYVAASESNDAAKMRIVLLTHEYPPDIYGGAGVHIGKLAEAMGRLAEHDIRVLTATADPTAVPGVVAKHVPVPCPIVAPDPQHTRLYDTLSRCLGMAAAVEGADIVHAHTWYTHFAALLVQQLTGARMLLTTHSLEPHRPWKREQLGRAYDMSSWIERSAYQSADGVVAVSKAMARDVHTLYGVDLARVAPIPNGIDPDEFQPTFDLERMEELGVDVDVPYVLFVGRITRQKGLPLLLRAARHLPDGTQLVLAAGQPDTPEIAEETTALVKALQDEGRIRVVWLDRMLSRRDVALLYSGACVFACPSVYEPFGIINLEAMACACPVVATRVGGIPEVVVDGETGTLVAFTPVSDENPDPLRPERFAQDFAAALTELLQNPAKARAMGEAGRARVEARFTWSAIAEATLAFYRRTLDAPPRL